jgi:tetratricopeptide (TPR) repeat protein
MRSWVLAGLVLAACPAKEEKKAAAALVVDSGTAGPVVTAPEAGVTPAVQLIREADAALQGGRVDEAIAKASEALKGAPSSAVAKGAPSSAVANNLLGRAHAAKFAATKDPAEAEAAKAAYEKTLAADPSFWPALQNLGELAEKQGRREEAAASYRRVLEAQPDHPEAARWKSLGAADR